jgi:hypothetical protein
MATRGQVDDREAAMPEEDIPTVLPKLSKAVSRVDEG